MSCISNPERCIWVNGPLIVGAGPSGLAVGACLKDHGVPFIILERSNCIASLWQNRTYDRLKLHLPKQFCQLPNFPFPKDYPTYPTKHQFIKYLESYAEHFDLQPQFNETVKSAIFDEANCIWRVRSLSRNVEVEYICQWLVVASGENAESFVPEIEGSSDFSGEVLHASDYKSGKDFEGKKVLVVGCGNSGMELCLDLCLHNAIPSLVVRDSVHVLPRKILGKSTFELAVTLMKWVPVWLADRVILALARMVIGNVEKYGLKRPKLGPMEMKNKQGKTPVLDIGTVERIRSGDIRVVPGIKKFMHEKVELVDGEILDVDSVIYATGYRSNVPSWLLGFEFFSKEGFPNENFPEGWKGKYGIYAVGFTRKGLSGTSSDAVKIAEDVAEVWKKERKEAKHITCRRCCLPQYEK